MKKLATAAVMFVMGAAAPAFAQMAPAGQTPPPAAGHFAPSMPKGEDKKGLEQSVKANNDAWDHQDPSAILNAWAFPVNVITTDSAGATQVVQADDATARAAFTALFASIPKPAPGQKAAEIKFGGQKVEFLSNTLAVVTNEAKLTQGAGKTQFKLDWKVTQVWSRESSGWRVRGYNASGWGDLMKH